MLRELITRITGAKYEVRMAGPRFPPLDSRASWYVNASEITESARTTAINAAWRDVQGSLVIESDTIGNLSEWVERQYGEVGAVALGKFDFGDLKAVRKNLARNFPLTDQFLKECEQAAASVSSKYNLDLSIRSDGDKGVAIFYLDARLNSDVGRSDEGQLKLAAKALEEALRRIAELEVAEVPI